MKNKIIIILLIIMNISIFAEATRLKEISRVKGVRSNQLMGLGLVVGLSGQGDSSDLTPQMMQGLLKYFGNNLANSQIASKNVAAVMITAELPPFKQPGDKIDITVSSVNDAKSLEGGVLLQTYLKAGNGEIYAIAQGSLTKVNNETNNTVNGYIQNGAIVEKEVPITLDFKEKVTLILNNPDFTTASRVAEVVNKRFSYDTAKAIDASSIEINKAYLFSNDLVSFISAIENLEVNPDRKSVIVINEKTGTIILGKDINISPVAISQNDLSISIDAQTDLKKAFEKKEDSFATEEEVGSFYYEGATVKNVVEMLNAIGATPDDIISILQALKVAGAIDAQIKVM